MKVSTLAGLLGVASPESDFEITGVVCDSRKAAPGSVFFCLRGAETDGHRFAAKAVEQGASALVVEEPVAIDVPRLVVADSRRALAVAAEAQLDYPSRSLRLIGVTGTNGKTTTTHLIRQLLEAAGEKTGLMGTNHTLIGDAVIPAVNTTPESVEISGFLRRMADEGCRSAVMEVSSHGLKQGRVSALDFDVAAFTNLTQDHLDYHGDFDDYLKSKLLLFTNLKDTGRCVVNADDPFGKFFTAAAPGELLTYGCTEKAALRAREIRLAADGTRFELVCNNTVTPVYIPLAGQFNVYNALAALGVALSCGLELPFIVEQLARAQQVRGRFQRVEHSGGPAVVVDYAHSPDGLENILRTAQAIKKGRLILVFGCGGDRDNSKRPLMGEIAGSYADFSVITSDNPRTEEPHSIIAMIEPGMKRSGGEYMVEADRRTAIQAAISRAGDDDLVVIAGKGHEDYQILGKTKIHFDDFEEAGAALAQYHPAR